MKKIIYVFMLLFTISNISYGQKPDSVKPQNKQHYLVQSKIQQKIATVSGITGAVAFTVGLFIGLSEFGKGWSRGSHSNANKAKTGEMIMYIGGGMILAAIPLQIASNMNKKKAMTIAFKNQRIQYLIQNHIVSYLNPSLNLTISF